MDKKSSELKNTSYELFIGALSVLSILNLILYYLLPDDNVASVLLHVDTLLSVIFICDFLYRLFSADSKSNYFFRQMGWADLLASLPAPQFKILRLFRILRVLRLMRAYGGARLLREFLANRSGSALLSLLFIMILVLEFGAMAILHVESTEVEANIKDSMDAIWYVYVTITTVGYGDQYPVSETGRIVGILIMAVGVGLFGTMTAFLADFFIQPEDDQPAEPADPSAAPADMTVQMSEIKNMLIAQEQISADLKSKIAVLEMSMKKNGQ